MDKHISVGNHSYQINLPDECPICHHFGDTQIINNFEHPKTREVQVILQCAFPECRKYFIGYYPPKHVSDCYDCKSLTPQKPNIVNFPDTITIISSQFLSIYKEAEEANALGLKQIAGPGYRKAFEFLIKDYAKSLEPKSKEEIEKSFSGDVVKKYILDQRIQSMAKRALWLGNDESHYLRKWEKHDIDDLLTLIKIVTDWIDIEQLSKKYVAEMPEPI